MDQDGKTKGGGLVTAAIWAALCLIWGSSWLFIKIGLEDLPPFSFAGIRFVVALVPLFAWMGLRRSPVPGRSDWRLLAVTAMLSFLGGYGLVFWGEQYISSGLTAVLFTSFSLFGLLFAHMLVPAEPLVARKVIGVVLGMAGIAAIFSDQLFLVGRHALLGCLAVVLSAACAALSSVLIKSKGGHLDPVTMTAWQMLLGAIPLLLAGFLLEGNPLLFNWTPKALFSLFYLALAGSALAFVLWYTLLQRVEVTKAQTLPLVNTLMAVLLGWMVLGEKLGPRQAAGGAAILLGTALVLTAPKARRV